MLGLSFPAFRAALILAATLLWSAGLAQDPGTQPAKPGISLGWNAGTGSGPFPGEASWTRNALAGTVIRIVTDWNTVEGNDGTLDFTGVKEQVKRAAEAGAAIHLCLAATDSADPGEDGLFSPLDPSSLAGWIRFVRGAEAELGPWVDLIEVMDLPSGTREQEGYPADIYAYILKQSILAIRAEAAANGAKPPRIAQGAVDASRLDWQRELWENETSAYVDVLPVRYKGGTGEVVARTLQELMQEAVKYPPAPQVVVQVEWSGGEGEVHEALGAVLAGLNGGAAVGLLDLSDDLPVREELAGWLGGMQAALNRGFGPAPSGKAVFHGPDGGIADEGSVLGSFFNSESFEALLVFRFPEAPDSGSRARPTLDLPGGFVRNPYILDPLTGTRLRTSSTRLEGDGGAGGGRRIKIRGSRFPLVLEYQAGVATPDFDLETEQLEVDRTRGLSAAEIIARYQTVQEVQDDKIDRWMADARVDYHFKFAQGGTNVDVSIQSRYFWQRGGDLTWEQSEFRVNGAKVPWKKFPEIPLIQPEKVVTLPLDLTLDKTYRYRLAGRDRVGGREAYVLAFDPIDPDPAKPLYRGRIWIDVERFTRLKVSLVQDNLEPPVLANNERDFYEPVKGPDGGDLWMVSHINGQQVWSVGGESFLVQREVHFLDYKINPEADRYDAALDEAYRSENQMLQDTSKGFRYLDRQKDGSRTVRETMDTSQLFAAGGLFKDNGLDSVVPLAGVNYFDYDLFGKGIQTNLLFAGVLFNGTATHPDLFGKKIDMTLNVNGSALKFEDKVFDADQELLAERIETRRQAISLQVGFPIGPYLKLNVAGNLDLVKYFQEKEASEFRASLATPLQFILPPDHTVAGGTAELVLSRRGYTASASHTWSTRSEWAPWGLFDPGTSQFLGDPFDPASKRYTRWQASINKEWFLPKFQKIRAEYVWMSGSDLDRFSQYEFTFFGQARLSGFSGSGVRFEDGGILRVGYSFNLFDVIQLDAAVQSASVRNPLLDDVRRRFTGAGLNLNLPGPWRTFIVLNYGHAVSADIPDLDGEQEFMLTVLKLF